MAKPTTTTKRRKTKRTITSGILNIQATFNNTIVTVADPSGAVVAWSSAGAAGFKGSRKSTPYAAQIAGEKVATAAKDLGMAKVDVVVRGVGSGRESAIRAFQAIGIEVASIKDATGIPHNGCRPRKARRV